MPSPRRWHCFQGVQTSYGVLRMPGQGPAASSWICLGGLEVQRPQGWLESWSANDLSVVACEGGTERVSLEFDLGGYVQGEFHGEPVAWTNPSSRILCDRVCTMYFQGGSGTMAFMLDTAGAYLAPNTMVEVRSSTWLHEGAGASLACGGGGTVITTYSETGALHESVQLEGFGATHSCPGEPLDGQLSGSF